MTTIDSINHSSSQSSQAGFSQEGLSQDLSKSAASESRQDSTNQSGGEDALSLQKIATVVAGETYSMNSMGRYGVFSITTGQERLSDELDAADFVARAQAEVSESLILQRDQQSDGGIDLHIDLHIAAPSVNENRVELSKKHSEHPAAVSDAAIEGLEELALDDAFVDEEISVAEMEELTRDHHVEPLLLNVDAMEAPIGVDEELRKDLSRIPQKMAYKIGEAADMVGVKQYVLRYWETEFDSLRPRKSKNNQRVYTKREIENALLIKKLLYRDRFSIEGARAALKSLRAQVKEEKEIKTLTLTLTHKHEMASLKMRSLIDDLRRFRSRFN